MWRPSCILSPSKPAAFRRLLQAERQLFIGRVGSVPRAGNTKCSGSAPVVTFAASYSSIKAALLTSLSVGVRQPAGVLEMRIPSRLAAKSTSFHFRLRISTAISLEMRAQMDDSPLKRKEKALVSDFPRSGKGMVQGIHTVGYMAFLLGNPHILQNI